MTDEEYGRRWCEQTGYHPTKEGRQWRTIAPGLPFVLVDRIDKLTHSTEAAAYAAIGLAVRQLHEQVPQLKGDK